MPRLTRSLAALFALWFAIVVGDPGMLHSCPMHGGHGAAAATPADAHASHDAHAAHAAHGTQTHQPDADAPCTCIGHCSAVTAPAPVSANEVVVASVVAAHSPALPDVQRIDVPASADVRLQFAIGPPRA